MKKFHINEQGEVKICTAKTSESCTVKKFAKKQHFTFKNRAYVKSEMNKTSKVNLPTFN